MRLRRPTFQQSHDGSDDLAVFSRLQPSHFGRHQRGIGRKQLSRPRKTGAAQGTGGKIRVSNRHSCGVPIWVAGNLAEHPVAATGSGKHYRGPQLGGGKIGEGKLNENYRLGCRCDHAASSSGRFQSSASADSLKKAVSAMTVSSTMVTMARQACARLTGSLRRTLPSFSIVASMDVIIPVSLSIVRYCSRSFPSAQRCKRRETSDRGGRI